VLWFCSLIQVYGVSSTFIDVFLERVAKGSHVVGRCSTACDVRHDELPRRLQNLLLGIRPRFLVPTSHEVMRLAPLGGEVHRRGIRLVVRGVDQRLVGCLVLSRRRLDHLVLLGEAPKRGRQEVIVTLETEYLLVRRLMNPVVIASLQIRSVCDAASFPTRTVLDTGLCQQDNFLFISFDRERG